LIFIIFVLSVRVSPYSTIPNIIHQTAPADKSKWNKIWEECQKTWKDKFPNYEYKMWTDEDLDMLMKTQYPDDYEMFYSFSKIRKIDTARYYILNTYGGIYADMDYECIQNFEAYLSPDKVSIAEAKLNVNEKFQNALMISPKNHPLWENYIFPDIRLNKDVKDVKEIRYIDPNKEYVPFNTDLIIDTCGPQILCRAWELKPEFIHPLPADEFSVTTVPYHQTKNKAIYGNDVYAVHHGTFSWLNAEYR
jgi:hypothetical protein